MNAWQYLYDYFCVLYLYIIIMSSFDNIYLLLRAFKTSATIYTLMLLQAFKTSATIYTLMLLRAFKTSATIYTSMLLRAFKTGIQRHIAGHLLVICITIINLFALFLSLDISITFYEIFVKYAWSNSPIFLEWYKDSLHSVLGNLWKWLS